MSSKLRMFFGCIALAMTVATESRALLVCSEALLPQSFGLNDILLRESQYRRSVDKAVAAQKQSPLMADPLSLAFEQGVRDRLNRFPNQQLGPAQQARLQAAHDLGESSAQLRQLSEARQRKSALQIAHGMRSHLESQTIRGIDSVSALNSLLAPEIRFLQNSLPAPSQKKILAQLHFEAIELGRALNFLEGFNPGLSKEIKKHRDVLLALIESVTERYAQGQ